MGAFNTVKGEAVCPVCGEKQVFDVQFKYGDTWQHKYCVGAKLKWGGNDIGRAGHEEVIVEGIGGPCESCGTDNIEFDIVLRRDLIVEIIGIGTDRSNPSDDGFVINK